MEETAKKLEITADAIEKANMVNEENIKDLKDNIKILESKITSLQGKTEEVLNRYESSNSESNPVVVENMSRENLEWADSKNE